MILIIDQHNRAQYAGYLKEMHKVRHDLFVGRNGWTELFSPFGLEVDQFDSPKVTYFLKLSRSGKVMAGIRTIPTIYNNMLSDLYIEKYADYFRSPDIVPHDPNIWEMSRYFVADPEFKSETGHYAKQELFVAMFEYALSKGVTAVCGMTETYILSRAAELGWRLEYLSMPIDYEGCNLEGIEGRQMSAIRLEVDQDLVDATRARWRLHHKLVDGAMEPVPEQPGEFNPTDIYLMTLFATRRPELYSVFLDVVKRLGSGDPEVVAQAEIQLNQMTDLAMSAGFKRDDLIEGASAAVN